MKLCVNIYNNKVFFKYYIYIKLESKNMATPTPIPLLLKNCFDSTLKHTTPTPQFSNPGLNNIYIRWKYKYIKNIYIFKISINLNPIWENIHLQIN